MEDSTSTYNDQDACSNKEFSEDDKDTEDKEMKQEDLLKFLVDAEIRRMQVLLAELRQTHEAQKLAEIERLKVLYNERINELQCQVADLKLEIKTLKIKHDEELHKQRSADTPAGTQK